MSAWARAAATLRPLPFRGDLIAAGAVAFAVGIVLLDVRVQEDWAAGVRVVVVGLAAALLLALGWRAPREGDAPRVYVSALLLAAFPLTGLALLDLADALGGGTSAGSLTWVLAAVAALYLGLALRRGSAACTLLGALALIATAMAAWAWIFDPRGVTPYEWLALAGIVAAGLGAVVLRDGRRAHAVALVDVAGVTALVLAYLVAFAYATTGWVMYTPLSNEADLPGAPWGWKLVLAAVGFGLVAYGAVDRERGPAWLGAAVLAAFVALAATSGALLWWPLILVAAGGVAIAAGLRPTTPPPPAPDADAPAARPRPIAGETS